MSGAVIGSTIIPRPGMKLSAAERKREKLSEKRLATACETLRTDGYVVLENAVPAALVQEMREVCNTLTENFAAAHPETFNPDRQGHGIFDMHPPREMPFMDPLIIANPFIVPILREALGEGFFCAFYNTNTSWPGSGIQRVHRDSPPLVEDHPLALPPYSIALNVPLVDFTAKNGATELWPTTQLDNRPHPQGASSYDEWAAEMPSALMDVAAGSLVLRDMRMWHRGMPNRTQTIRTMLAVVYNRLFYDFNRKLDIPSQVWGRLSEEAREIFRFNSVVDL